MIQLTHSDQLAQTYDNERHAIAAQSRLAASTRRQRRTVARRAAGMLGRALLQLGVGLLRYGRAETPATMPVYQPSTGSIRLN
jgi:hypothetical protein